MYPTGAITARFEVESHNAVQMSVVMFPVGFVLCRTACMSAKLHGLDELCRGSVPELKHMHF
jgi:hypothetical protein